jgi:ubiquitin C-terminal hydrolase
MSEEELSRQKSISRGLSGLNNMGNTCYMNSVLQSISSTNLLNYYLRKSMFKEKLKIGIRRNILKKLKESTDLKSDDEITISRKKIKHKFKNSITYRLYQVLKIMWNINCELKPEKFKASVDKILPQFRGFNQHDGHEFLIYLLDTIHEEIKSNVNIKKFKLNKISQEYVDRKEELKKQLELTQIDTAKEAIKQELKQIYNNNYLIDVQYEGLKFYKNFLKDNHSIITDLFYGLFASEVRCQNCNNRSMTYEPFNVLQLDMDKQYSNFADLMQNVFTTEEINYKCDECKHDGKANKTLYIHMLPDKLIIQFKRFIVNGRHSRKNCNLVPFPLDNLNVSEITRDAATAYELYSVINHMGDVGGGHYTNYSKNSITNEWYEFNDSRVSYLTNPQNEIISPNAYVLFYQKKQ